MYKIIGADGNEYGPESAEQLRHWIAEGRANGQTLAQAEGTQEWKPLSAFGDFAAALAASGAHGASAGAPPAPGASVPMTQEELLARDYDLDIGSCLARSWALWKSNMGPLVGITLLVALIQAGVNQIIAWPARPAFDQIFKDHQFTPSNVSIVLFCSWIGGPVYIVLLGGLYKYYLKVMRGEPATLGDAFYGVSSAFGPLALLALVMTPLVWLGLLFCFVPGMYLSVAWVFAIPLVVDKQLGFWEAMELSRKVVTRHWFMVFAMGFVAGVVAVCGVFACCVGIVLTLPIGWVALMYAYEDLFSRKTP
jgi:hypothetical protein